MTQHQQRRELGSASVTEADLRSDPRAMVEQTRAASHIVVRDGAGKVSAYIFHNMEALDRDGDK